MADWHFNSQQLSLHSNWFITGCLIPLGDDWYEDWQSTDCV